MASNEESSRRGHTYGSTTAYDSILQQGDIYLINEKPKIDCREALLLKDPFIYRESLKNDKGERASGTCEWIRENEIYRSWLEGDEHCLWICGGPGKGKTMLSIFLTEELERKQHKREDDQDTTLLYFFCTNGNENYNNAIAVLRGLAYQLLSKHPDISTSVSPYFETAKHTENTLSSPETLWMVFKTLLRAPKLGIVYCILDGLDECDEKSIGRLIKLFRNFYSPSDLPGPIAQNLKLAIVSRKINGLEGFPKIQLDPDNDNRINEDIKRFISTGIQELSRRGYDDNFLRNIENSLIRRSKGTFLWIGFVMNQLLEMSTRMEVMEVLMALPQGLPDMYGRMLQQIKSSQRHIISAILKCVTIAPRPMTLEELKTAVSLLCNTPIDSTPIMRDRIASCGPILQLSEGQDICSLVHQSARDYLLREEQDKDPILEQFRIKAKEAHTSLAKICLAYIENSDFRHKSLDITDASVIKKSPLLGYATKYWPEHARHAEEDLNFSKTFFQEKNDMWKHWWQAYRDDRGWVISHMIGTQPLHVASYLGIDSLVRKILQSNAWRISLKFRNYVDQRNDFDRTPLILAAHEGHHSVVQLLLANGADVNESSKYTGNLRGFTRGWGCTALEAAAERGHLSVIQLLVANGADLKLRGNDSALHQAAEHGHEAVVHLLLTKGADVNLATTRQGDYIYAKTPLSLAAGNGHEATVQLLLANGADIDIHMEYRDGHMHTPLHEAAIRGHKSIIQLLLSSGADIHIKDKFGRTALHKAAQDGHEAVVHLLLTRGADVNINDNCHITPISLAAGDGHEAIVRLLLANGADAHIKDCRGSTALFNAAYRGHETIVQLLLRNGADVNIKDSDSFTPLSIAADRGHEAIVRLLLANGADVNIQTKHRHTALGQAACNGHEAIVQQLLENGSDSKHDAFNRALAGAAWGGHEAVVRLLLANSAHSNIKDGMALIRAAEEGHEHILRMLLEDVADINARYLDNSTWHTALEMAAASGRTTTVRFLIFACNWRVERKREERIIWRRPPEHYQFESLLKGTRT